MQRGWPVVPPLLSPSLEETSAPPPQLLVFWTCSVEFESEELKYGHPNIHPRTYPRKLAQVGPPAVGFQGPPKGDNSQGTSREHSWALGRRKPKLRGSTSAPSLCPFTRHLGGAGSGKYNPDSTEGIFSLPRREVGYLPTGFESTGYKSLVSGINTEGSLLLPQSCQSEEDMAIPSWSSWADGED